MDLKLNIDVLQTMVAKAIKVSTTDVAMKALLAKILKAEKNLELNFIPVVS